jgi:hypothetical protein
VIVDKQGDFCPFLAFRQSGRDKTLARLDRALAFLNSQEVILYCD